MNYFDQIGDYLENVLDSAKRKAFEQELEANQDLSDAVKHYRSIGAVMDASIELDVAAIVEEVNSSNQAKGRNLKFIWILAGFLFLALAYFWSTKSSIPDDTPTQFAQLYIEPEWPIERGKEYEINTAVSQFFAGDKAVALDNLRKLKSEEANYWIAELHLSDQAIDSAQIYLSFSNLVNKDQRDRMIYMQYIIFKYKNNKKAIEQMIKTLPDDLDDFYRKRMG